MVPTRSTASSSPRVTDGTIFVFGDDTSPEEVAAAADADEDVAGWLMAAYVVGVEAGPGGNEPGAYSAGLLRIDETAPIEWPAVIEGRMPDPDAPFEIAVNDVHRGGQAWSLASTIDLGLLRSDQIDSLDAEPALGVHRFTVVGITRTPIRPRPSRTPPSRQVQRAGR